MARTSTQPARGVISRVVRVARQLPSESRLAAVAAIGLVVSLFLPWYQQTLLVPGSHRLQSASVTLTGWGAFSWVEGAVLLVSAAVLTLLFMRAEGRAFHLPGADGAVIMAAGAWTSLLVVWRIFDKQGAVNNGQSATTTGVEWGIFVAFAMAGLLAYAGARIRAAHRPEPPLPGEREREPADAARADVAPARNQLPTRGPVPAQPLVRKPVRPLPSGDDPVPSSPSDAPSRAAPVGPLGRLFADPREPRYEQPGWSAASLEDDEPPTRRVSGRFPTPVAADRPRGDENKPG